MDDVAAITHHLEYMFLKKIISGLRDKTMSIAQAKQHSIDFLAIEPFATIEDASNKTDQFVLNHPEFISLKDYVEVFEKEAGVAGKIDKMREHIKLNNIDAAIEVARS